MQQYTNNVQDRSGNAIAGANVQVLTKAGATAVIYSDNGVTQSPNPFQTDDDGEFNFYAASGNYTITITGSMLPAPIEFGGIALLDPDDVNAELRTDLASTDSGKGAAMVSLEDGRTVQERLDDIDDVIALETPKSSARQFWGRITSGERDVKLLVIGDSTGNETWEWVYLMSSWLATQAPTHTIKYRLFDSSTGWPSATTLATGSGSLSIEVWNGSVAGSTAEDIEGGKEAAFWGANDFDLVILNTGHNYGTTSTEESMYQRFMGTASNVLSIAPRADLLVTLQNPRNDAGGAQQSANAAAAWRQVAANIGCGVIDVQTQFLNAVDPMALMADTVHPNASGQAVWVAAVKKQMARPATYDGAPMPVVRPLGLTGQNHFVNPRFSTWTGSVPKGWTVTNATVERDPFTAEGSLYVMKATAGASGTPTLVGSLSGARLAALRGKTVTMLARVYKPAGMDALAGRCGLVSNNGASSVFFTSNARIDKSINGWTWEIAQIKVQTDATSLTGTVYLGGNSGVDSGKSLRVESVALFAGSVPYGIDNSDEINKALLTWYSPDAVMLHPTSGSGTLTVAANVITVSGATDGLTGVVINLPPLVGGEMYQLRFKPTSTTAGGATGYVYIRNGANGGSSNIVVDSWSVTGSLKTVDFTGVESPVSVWLGIGGGGFTAWSASDFDVVQLP